MPINAFDPRTLQRMIEVRQRPILWYSSKYFKKADRVAGTRTVERPKRVQTQAMAPFQRPTERSRMVDRDSVDYMAVQVPYMKPGMPTSAEEIIQRRTPGDHLYSEKDLRAEAQAQIARDIADLDDMIERRKEWMAAQGIITGRTPVVNLDDEGKASINAEVDWNMPASHLITLTGTDLWSDRENSDPLANIKAWRQMCVRHAMVAPDILTLGIEAALQFTRNETTLKLMDNRRVEAGNVELKDAGLEQITMIAMLADGTKVYEDARTYIDDSGNVQYYTPVGRAVLGGGGHENAWAHGPISDLKCPNPRSERWVKTWEVEDPSQRNVAVHSSSLPCVWQPDASVSALVV